MVLSGTDWRVAAEVQNGDAEAYGCRPIVTRAKEVDLGLVTPGPAGSGGGRDLMWTGLIGVLASPASAKGTPHFKGDAPGLVVCNLSASVGFSPAITESGGGTNPSSVKGKLSGCVASNSDVTITSGAVKGSFASSPLDCATSSATGTAATLTVTWKGDFNGTVGGTVGLGGVVTGGTTYAGSATYTSSNVAGGTVTGSFTGNSTVTVNVPSDLTSKCEAKKGAKKLAVTGTFAVGATSGPGGGGGGGSLPTDTVQIVGEGHSSGISTTRHRAGPTAPSPLQEMSTAGAWDSSVSSATTPSPRTPTRLSQWTEWAGPDP